MFFLILALIYLAGTALCAVWMRRMTSSSSWEAALVTCSLFMAAGTGICGVVGVMMGGLPGVLRLISLIVYHVMVIQPLFLVTGALIALGLGLIERRPRKRLIAFVCASCVAAGVACWSTQVEPFWLETVSVTHMLSPPHRGDAVVRVGVLADLQNDDVTAHQRHVVQTLMAQRPDMILIPGDLYDSDAALAHTEKFRALLGELDAPAGVFMVVGDHDTLPALQEMTRGTKVVLLDDEVRAVMFKDRQIDVIGLSQPDRASFSRAMSSPTSPDSIRIVLVHRPRLVQHLSREDRVDLVVSGHTHGGQINVPGFGPPVTISPLPREVAAGGLHRVNDTPLYISRGVGGVQLGVPLIRFNCRPELTVISLRSARTPQERMP